MVQGSAWGIVAILFASIIWGTTGTAATFAPDVSAAAIGAAAMGLGGVAMCGVAWPGIRRARLLLRQQRSIVIVGGMSVGIYPLAFYESMHMAGVTVGTVVTIGSAPLLSALLEYVLDRVRLTPRWMIGAGIGIAGMVLIAMAEGTSHVVGAQSLPLGIALGLVGGLTYALYSWSARRLMLGGVGSTAAMGSVFGLGGVMLLPVLFVTGGPYLASWSNAAVGLYMALGPVLLGYVCFGYGLARLSASTATTISLVEPVVAAVLAVVIVGERLPAIGWIGVALIVGCLAIITLPVPRIRRVRGPVPNE